MDDVLLWGFIAFGVMIAVIVFTVLFDYKKNGKEYKKQMEEIEEKKFSEEGELITMHAEIVDMLCGTGMVGSYRLPKSVKSFVIVFKNDDGEVTELLVPEEYYLELSLGQRGTLTLLEGRLDSFVLDGEVIGDEEQKENE